MLLDGRTDWPARRISNAIAACHEKALERWPLADAQRMLYFSSRAELMDFAKEVGRRPRSASSGRDGAGG